VDPETRYAKSGDVHIAYQVVGEGPLDIVYTPGWVSNVEAIWEIPMFAASFERLKRHGRLIVWDKRGTGLSDPVGGVPTIDERMDDLRAVMDAAGSERAVLFGVSEGGPMSLLFAATYPERTLSLILYGAAPRLARAPDYPWGFTEEQMHHSLSEIEARWGKGALAEVFAPQLLGDEAALKLYARYQRAGASPGTAKALFRSLGEIDVRSVLPSVRVPTLILHHAGDLVVPVEGARLMAERIPGARLAEFPGRAHVATIEEIEEQQDVVDEFLTGDRHHPGTERVLTTVLFTDIVGSTARAAELGDRQWRSVLDRHDAAIRRQLGRFRGTEIDTAGDGFLASFDGPARAVHCAMAAAEAVRPLGIEIRAGVHTGECERRGEKLGGIAVHIGARVVAHAGPGEVVVSRTVKDLVVGSGLQFSDRGEHHLKGVPDRWPLYAVCA
jgi:pimeloyl-ACP methyl ester carboxylesterase